MSSSLLLQQCLACLIRLLLIVFVMRGRWPYSCCFGEAEKERRQECCKQYIYIYIFENSFYSFIFLKYIYICVYVCVFVSVDKIIYIVSSQLTDSTNARHIL